MAEAPAASAFAPTHGGCSKAPPAARRCSGRASRSGPCCRPPAIASAARSG